MRPGISASNDGSYVICSNCAADNRPDAKFCRECGAALAIRCPACGAPNEAGQKFCDECGTALQGQASAIPAVAPRVAPAAERRVVSVLFADLVGFTALSESRDAEDVRELLSRYFDTCKRLISLYGGSVEKFIGDAVMAVWGTPVAQEDDAERAVRAALDLVSAVSALGDEVSASDLRARVGVLTGEAAVTIGAEGQGMVAGDLVNTASRIQALAQPGTVFVGEATKRPTEAAIAYTPAGSHTLKGKVAPVQLFRALRVTGARGGALKVQGLEAPFVGRERELRLIKELFHTSADEDKAQLVSVIGIAGIGKSRLSWEFEKYVDGLADDYWWHRGRCLSYGEGVAYWALAEMVRMRCDIAEDEDPASALKKLRAALAEYIPDPDERRWAEPRLAHLLGLEEGAPGDQENLFSAWRILFERLAEREPVVLVFEDMQWADAGLLDFIEYLLEWSRSYPLFVLSLARPELAEKRGSWGAGKRSFTPVYLEPLSPQAIDELLSGLAPGLPDDLRARILERAEGVPLYAVETVRMLLDRGLLERDGERYRPTGPVDTLEVPETLQALIAARLDSLTTAERRLVQDGSVLGKTFTKDGLAAVTGTTEEDLEPLLAALLRKEMLAIQADPRSPERGQYSFLQDVVKRVAYDTIAKKERKAKHLAAAQFLASTWSAEEDEIAEVVAAHYLDAYRAAPDDPDAPETRAKALEMVVRGAERAASLGANAEAQRSYEHAVELTEDPLVQAEFHERAGLAARAGGRADQTASHFEQAIARFEAANATHPAARVSARLAEVAWERGRLEHGLENMEQAFAVLSREQPDEDFATLAAQLGRFMFFAGKTELALRRTETALVLAETLWLPEVFSMALNTKAIILCSQGRKREGIALLRHALEVALEYDKPSAALRAYFNLGETLCDIDQYEEGARLVRDGLVLARRVGDRFWEWFLLGCLYPLYALGEWDEVEANRASLPDEDWMQVRLAFGGVLTSGVPVTIHRGELGEAKRVVDFFAELETSADVQEGAYYADAKSRLLLAEGKPADALEAAEAALEGRDALGITHHAVKESFVAAVEASLQLGDVAKARALLAIVDAPQRGQISQFFRAQSSRFRAQLAAREGERAEAERLFKSAAGLFREMVFPFYLAVTILEHAEWLVGEGRGEEAQPLLLEAREIFERLGARWWLERTARVSGGELAAGAQA
jgi:class 3 adenylate cyclase/tetratricopeptide (TPR) repeat protein